MPIIAFARVSVGRIHRAGSAVRVPASPSKAGVSGQLRVERVRQAIPRSPTMLRTVKELQKSMGPKPAISLDLQN